MRGSCRNESPFPLPTVILVILVQQLYRNRGGKLREASEVRSHHLSHSQSWCDTTTSSVLALDRCKAAVQGNNPLVASCKRSESSPVTYTAYTYTVYIALHSEPLKKGNTCSIVEWKHPTGRWGVNPTVDTC